MKKYILNLLALLLFVFRINGQEEKIVDWINNNKITFQTCDPTSNNFDDLNSLGNLIKDKQLIGLGESTHGTKEFLQMKHRIFKYLVMEHGFTVFVTEDPYYQYSEINKYILGGNGDLNEISTHGYWGFNIKERYDLINWMKTYNRHVKDTNKKIKFFGMDSYQAELGKNEILNYLEKVDIENHERYVSIIDSLSGKSKNNLFPGQVEELQALLKKNSNEYIQKYMIMADITLVQKGNN